MFWVLLAVVTTVLTVALLLPLVLRVRRESAALLAAVDRSRERLEPAVTEVVRVLPTERG